MKHSPYVSLKRLRVVLAAAFAVLYTLLFLDVGHLVPPAVARVLVSVQAVPVLVRALLAGGGAVLGFTAILLLTLSYGRVYCSTLCPLGTLQDLMIRLGKKWNKRKRFSYTRAPFLYHYAVLAVAVILAITGSAALLDLFEPFSNFGRMVTAIGAPPVQLLNNGIAFITERGGFSFLVPIPVRLLATGALVGSLLFLAMLAFFSLRHGRFFCNTLCPAGALLGLISRFSFYRIAFDTEACDGCGACEKVCKAQCIDAKARVIDDAACVGCFNCLVSCPHDGLEFRARFGKYTAAAPVQRSVEVPVNLRRRSLFTNTAASVMAFGIQQTPLSLVAESGYGESRRHPVTPPGSMGYRHFTSLCTACHLCVAACPSQVLSPSFLEYGVGGIFQPKMNYDVAYCGYDCTVCGQVCPTGAIHQLQPTEKRLTQVGRAIFITGDCVVVSKNKDCGACSEHCPTKAVQMIPYSGTLKIPLVNDALCIGCGACEHACPTTPRKAIYVRALPVHQTAVPPTIRKVESKYDSSKEFPF